MTKAVSVNRVATMQSLCLFTRSAKYPVKNPDITSKAPKHI